MPVRGLTAILGEPSPVRLRSLLTLLLAQRALGGGARLFLEGAAVALLRAPLSDAEDFTAFGLPPLHTLWGEALDAGVAIAICQSGLQLAKLDATILDSRFDYGGPIWLLQKLGSDRIIS